jgi:hypothetical protein
MTTYHHTGDVMSTFFSPVNAFFLHQAKDWGRRRIIGPKRFKWNTWPLEPIRPERTVDWLADVDDF